MLFTDDYNSIEIRKRFVSQAWRVWIVGLTVVFGWVLLSVFAPLLKAKGFAAASSPFYTFFSFLCHQLPERSLHIAGEPLAVCSRCFGVYFGMLFGFAIYPFWRNIEEIDPLPKFWLLASLIPMSIDWALTFFGIWENTQSSRFFTGMIVGVACATFIIPALVEITRNFTYRRKHLLDD